MNEMGECIIYQGFCCVELKSDASYSDKHFKQAYSIH